ncbi:CRTAC1 family protein [Haloarchaeobius sp. HRN-SO-5]|uniref:CRTAC1 family protein n=1 Tax=Haloarchaeobius sp. HRN-SO-5 TaxID=3446118 RepID=UPI003EC09E14
MAALLLASAGCAGMGSPPTAPDPTIDFRDRSDTAGLEYRTDGGGAGNGNDGVYVVDYDRDGWQDVLAVGGDAPVLFRNDGGQFGRARTFSAVGDSVKSALFFDADGDGWEDLLLLRPHDEPVLYHNDGGQFERSGTDFGTLAYPMGATAADYDRDGDLDLLVYQSGDWANGKPEGYFSLYEVVEEDNGHPNVLYENTGDGFERVEDSTLSDSRRWSLAASFVDLTGDGLPDVHVANDYNTDVVYVNDGDGTFEERPLRGNTSRNGMASEVVDVNGDGAQDVFTTNIYLPLDEVEDDERHERLRLLFGNVIQSGRTKGNTLMVNDGTGNLSDRAVGLGVRQGGWGWAASATDLDNDGDRDLIHATQYVARIDRDDPHYTYPMLFERDGARFRTLDASARNLSEHDGRGLVTLDYDRDGDRDVVVAPYDGDVRLYENVGATANSIAFRVVDVRGATVYGAEVTVSTASRSTVVQQTVRSDFLSQESRVSHLGLGSHDRVDLTVTFPDGTTRTFEDVDANQRVRLSRDGIESVGRWDEDDERATRTGSDAGDDGAAGVVSETRRYLTDTLVYVNHAARFSGGTV